ncbi:MAG: flagellar biosynthetic protein FliO [Brevinematia bacterium]
MVIRAIIIILLVFLFSPNLFFGQVTNTNEGFLDKFYEREEVESRGFWGIVIDILNVIVAVVIILVIVYIALRFLRKAIGAPVDDFGIIEIMASKAISQGIAIYIIRIGKDYYVMSSGDRGLNLLTKIEDKELINILNIEKSKQANNLKEDFIDTLMSLFRGKTQDKPESKISESRIEFIRNQKNRMKDLEQ